MDKIIFYIWFAEIKVEIYSIKKLFETIKFWLKWRKEFKEAIYENINEALEEYEKCKMK